jgi:hypothetical protein
MSAGMERYTVIMLYRGGTFVSQVQAKSVRGAELRWPDSQDWSTVLNSVSRETLLGMINTGEHEPTPLDGLRNAWCTSFLLGKKPRKLALVYFIKTAPQ